MPGRDKTGDKRGSSRERRARREWLVKPEAGFGGNGEKVPCVHCGAMVTACDMDVDRIVPGGSYRRDNIQPSCAFDNRSRGNKPNWTSPIVLAATMAAGA
jgi:hypothetical protein